MLSQSQLSQLQFYAKMDYFKTFHNILRAISFSEVAVFQIGSHGIKIILEEARTVQVRAYFTKNSCNFSEYQFKEQNDEPVSFSINLKIIIANLNMWLETDCQYLKLMYKGEGSELVLVMDDGDGFMTECSIKTQELLPLLDLKIDDNKNLVQITFRGNGFFDFMNDLFQTVVGAENIEISVTPKCFSAILRGSVEADAQYNIDQTSDIVMDYKCANPVKIRYKSANVKLMLKTLHISKTITLNVDNDGTLAVRLVIEENQFQSYVEYFVMPLDDGE